jgi:hypothetical protein
MMYAVVAVSHALRLCVKYAGAVRVRRGEWKSYYAKAVNLSLCYTGFVAEPTVAQASGAGRAAFFCALYDVITDCRHYDEASYRCFLAICDSELSAEPRGMAVALYGIERSERLEEGGLSRGVVALSFVTQVIGSQGYLERIADMRELGTVCQIVDDVLDLESDTLTGDTNCLQTPARHDYLRMLVEFDTDFFRRHFPYSAVLRRVFLHAQRKARALLAADAEASLCSASGRT